jgi:hypothetical protein
MFAALPAFLIRIYRVVLILIESVLLYKLYSFTLRDSTTSIFNRVLTQKEVLERTHVYFLSNIPINMARSARTINK